MVELKEKDIKTFDKNIEITTRNGQLRLSAKLIRGIYVDRGTLLKKLFDIMDSNPGTFQ